MKDYQDYDREEKKPYPLCWYWSECSMWTDKETHFRECNHAPWCYILRLAINTSPLLMQHFLEELLKEQEE